MPDTPTRIQVSDALVTLAAAAGMLQAFACQHNGTDLGQSITDMMEGVEKAAEVLRVAAGAA